jgi:hypothetical protein
MHYLIKLLVVGDNAKDALTSAESYAKKLCGDGNGSGTFDWYDMHGRWGDSKAYKLESKEGQAILKEGMEGTRREFNSAMAHVRYMVEHFTDDEIYNGTLKLPEGKEKPENVYYLSRWQFLRAYGGGNGVYVYSEDWGEAIDCDKDLIAATGEYKPEGQQWVVAVDFHN